MKLITLTLAYNLSITNLTLAASYKKCSAFTHFDNKINKCINNICVCENGSPNIEGSCPKHNGNFCRCCKKGFTWKNWRCEVEGDTSALEPEDDVDQNPFDYNEPLEIDEEYEDYEDDDDEDDDDDNEGMEDYYPEDYEEYDENNDDETDSDYEIEEINLNNQNGIPSYNYVNVVNSAPKKPEKSTTVPEKGKMVMIKENTSDSDSDYDPESEAERWKKLAILYNRFRAAETDDSVLIAMDPDFPEYVEKCGECTNCYLPHKRAEALFVHCGHGLPYFKGCPANLVWSQELMVCTWGNR